MSQETHQKKTPEFCKNKYLAHVVRLLFTVSSST